MDWIGLDESSRRGEREREHLLTGHALINHHSNINTSLVSNQFIPTHDRCLSVSIYAVLSNLSSCSDVFQCMNGRLQTSLDCLFSARCCIQWLLFLFSLLLSLSLLPIPFIHLTLLTSHHITSHHIHIYHHTHSHTHTHTHTHTVMLSLPLMIMMAVPQGWGDILTGNKSIEQYNRSRKTTQESNTSTGTNNFISSFLFSSLLIPCICAICLCVYVF